MNHQYSHCIAVSNSIIQILSLLGRIKIKIMGTCLMCNIHSCENKKNVYLTYSGCNLHSLDYMKEWLFNLKKWKIKKLHGTQVVFIHLHNFLISQMKCLQTRLHIALLKNVVMYVVIVIVIVIYFRSVDPYSMGSLPNRI
jgi:hypothetical protein